MEEKEEQEVEEEEEEEDEEENIVVRVLVRKNRPALGTRSMLGSFPLFSRRWLGRLIGLGAEIFPSDTMRPVRCPVSGLRSHTQRQYWRGHRNESRRRRGYRPADHTLREIIKRRLVPRVEGIHNKAGLPTRSKQSAHQPGTVDLML